MSSSGLLVVVDLNGVLVERLHRNDIKARSLSDTVVRRSVSLGAGQKLFVRPGAREFVEFLFAQTELKVAIWSSMKRENVDKVVQQLLGAELAGKLLACLDRSLCIERASPGKPHDSIKDLTRVFDALPDAYRGRFTLRNTVLIDDSCLKATLAPTNAFCPPPFVVSETSDADSVLADLCRPMLESLLAALSEHAKATAAAVAPAPPVEPFDVRNVLQSMPRCAKVLLAEFEKIHPTFQHTPLSSPAPSPLTSPSPRESPSPIHSTRRKLVLDDSESCAVFVGGLSGKVGPQEVQAHFAACGLVMTLSLRARSAVIEFSSAQGAAAALLLNGSVLEGTQLKVEPFRPPGRGRNADGARRALATSSEGASTGAVAAAPPPHASSQSEGAAVGGVQVVKKQQA
jgi:hypothetical protein